MMKQSASKSSDTRSHILAIGQELIAQRGFTGLGLGELLKQAKVPKGSFYHYFGSKEDFGCQLLEHYLATYALRLDELEQLPGLNGRERLLHYWQRWIETQSQQGCEHRCLIVKLSAEIADISPPMADILANGTQSIINRISQWIRQGQKDQSLASTIDASMTATLLYHMWLGASLRAKLQRDATPFLAAKEATQSLLPAPQ